MSEEQPLAIVEVYMPGTGEQPRLQLDCKVNSRQRWGMDIPLDTAEELYTKLGARLWEARSMSSNKTTDSGD